MNQRLRPTLPHAWSAVSPGLAELVSTIRHCWDQDAEARISAANVTERMKALREINQREREEADVTNEDDNRRRMNAANANSERRGVPEEHELTPLIINGRSRQDAALANT